MKTHTTKQYISAELGRHIYGRNEYSAPETLPQRAHRVSRIPELQNMHTAKITCDHCQGYHIGQSVLSMPQAYSNAYKQLDACRNNRMRRERAQANSHTNCERRERLMTDTGMSRAHR